MGPLSCVEILVLLSKLACAQAPAVGDYRRVSSEDDNASCGLESALFLGNTGASRTIIGGI
jgi:hypothetical protein